MIDLIALLFLIPQFRLDSILYDIIQILLQLLHIEVKLGLISCIAVTAAHIVLEY